MSMLRSDEVFNKKPKILFIIWVFFFQDAFFLFLFFEAVLDSQQNVVGKYYSTAMCHP